jgi:hypothetical protein
MFGHLTSTADLASIVQVAERTCSDLLRPWRGSCRGLLLSARQLRGFLRRPLSAAIRAGDHHAGGGVADALDYNGPILFRALKAAVAETGHQHGVDDVDDAVRLVDIRDRDHRLAALSVRPE